LAGTDPIHQFHIQEWVPLSFGGYDVSFTNSSAAILGSVVVASCFLYLATLSRSIVPSRGQSVAEVLYEFVSSTLKESAGDAGLKMFPFVFSLFMFVLTANMIGMFPYFFTSTSQLIVTVSLALLVITVVVLYGFYKNGFGFLKLFVPSGVPVVLVPLVGMIEFVSFLSRPISLSIRLFANMLAGHIMLKVFAGFIVTMSGLGAFGVLGAILPMIMAVALTGLEFLVAFLQAYVFTVLTCMYLNDAIHPGH
jgi:F-type H+-transporting ATPase subunit a